jgi:single-strand DNA-binding protein
MPRPGAGYLFFRLTYVSSPARRIKMSRLNDHGPLQDPRGRRFSRLKAFLTRHLFRAGLDHAIENRTPSPNGTQGETRVTTSFKHENVIKIAGVLGVAPELRLTANGNAVATLIVYTNYTPRDDDGSTRQESERHRVIVWGMHAEKAARLLRKGSKVHVQGRMTYPTWKDKQTHTTRYGAEIVAQTLDYHGANDEAEAPVAQSAAVAPAAQPAEPVAPVVEAPAKPKRRRAKKAELAAA